MQSVQWTNCALCPLLAVSCGDAGLALITLTVSSPRMDFIVNLIRVRNFYEWIPQWSILTCLMIDLSPSQPVLILIIKYARTTSWLFPPICFLHTSSNSEKLQQNWILEFNLCLATVTATITEPWCRLARTGKMGIIRFGRDILFVQPYSSLHDIT
jgi:hypothetical protein